MAIIGNQIQSSNYVSDSYSGDGSTVAFTLSLAPASAASISVYVSGLYQIPGSAYTVSGTTLTFTGAPPVGTNNIYVLYLGIKNQNLVPVNGSITPQMLNNANVVYWSTSNNNVGIGNTSPVHALSVAGSGNFTGSLNVATTFAAGNTTITGFNNSTTANVSSMLIVGTYGVASTGTGFRTTSQDIYGQVNAVDKVHIGVSSNSWFTGGSVGIGVSSPAALLHVSNGAVFFDNATPGTPKIELTLNASGTNYAHFYDTAQSSNNEIALGGSSVVSTVPSTPIMTWALVSGKVAIGKLNPAVSLDMSARTDAVYMPKGTQAQRPSAATGLMRYNTTGQWMEYYDGVEWVPMVFGAYLLTWSNTNYGLDAGSTWRNMGTLSCPDFGSRPKVLSVSFDGYITSGTYYWTWRLYNARTGSVLPSLGGYHSYKSYVSSGGGVQYKGNVHGMSAQPARAFDASDCISGDTIRLELSASTGEGDVVYTNAAQTLYVDNINWWAGALVGKETDTFWTA
jgi:hypothetical protein